ncbi:MAG: methyl-accepting chemotaxis protein [Planctomycetota bacterium]
MKNVRLKTKIYLGLASVTALMIAVAWAGWYGISNASTGFTHYRELARDSNLCSGLQSKMLMVRMNAKDFIISSDPAAIQRYESYFAETNEYLDEAQREIGKPERASDVDAIEALLAEYESGFREVIDQQTTRNQVLNDTLNTCGPKIERALTNIMIDARQTGDNDAKFHAAISLRKLLLARLYVVKFFSSGESKDAARVDEEFDSFHEDLQILKEHLHDPEQRQLASTIETLATQYRSGFKTLVEATYQRAEIIDNTLDRIGPEIASLSDGIRLSVKSDQDELGPALRQSNQFYCVMIGTVGLLSLTLSVGIAIMLSRSIVGPLGVLVHRIREAEANYDLKVRFPVNGKDEIGVIATSLNSFIKNLHETISHVGDSTRSVVDASSQLTSTASELTDGAKTTKQHSSAANSTANAMNAEMADIAETTESMNCSFRNVSDSMEQLSQSIGEIAENATQASSVASEATALTNASRSIVGELDASAAEIGNVISVIQDIAEQTNLLALNATIEAARAGDAGKGFAVVATEVKELASQTARATEEVRQRISEIQASTDQTVGSIEQISNVIAQVDAVSTNIAAAVEEQSVTTSAINRSMSETTVASQKVYAVIQNSANSSTSLLESMVAVETAANSTAAGADQTRNAGESLATLADDVESLLQKFNT